MGLRRQPRSALTAALRSVLAAWALVPTFMHAEEAADRGDPIHSAACRDAMAAFDAALGAQVPAASASAASAASSSAAASASASASAPTRSQALGDLRQRAVRLCLGGADKPPGPRAAQPAATLAPPAPVPALHLPSGPGTATAPATRWPTLPATPTLGACDAAGCWASDGSRLNRLGPVLLAPGGGAGTVCSPQGAALRCR